MGRVMDTKTGNSIYQTYTRRLPLVMPTLDPAALDRAIADVGATPETVTDAQMLRALRATIFPLLSANGGSSAAAPAQAGLVTTDTSNRVRTITPVAAALLGLPPDVDVIGQPIAALPGPDRCVPPVAAFTDADAVDIRQGVISDGRRVQCISHLCIAADGGVIGVSTTVQDITLEAAVYAEVGPLYATSETRAEEVSAFAEIAKLIALTTSLDATLTAITKRATLRLGCRAAAIFLPNTLGQLELMGQYGLPDNYAETINAYIRFVASAPDEEQPPTTLAFRDGVPVYRNVMTITSEAPEGARATRVAAVTNGWAGIVAVPLVAKGATIGTLTCYFSRPEPPTEKMIWLMTTIADHAAIAVQNSALHAETERQLAEMTALHRTAALLNSSLDRSAVLHTIVEQAAQVTGARVCGLLELTSTGDATVPRAIYGMDHFPFKDVAILQHGPALYAIQQRAPLIVRSREEAAAMPWWRREFADETEHGRARPT